MPYDLWEDFRLNWNNQSNRSINLIQFYFLRNRLDRFGLREKEISWTELNWTKISISVKKLIMGIAFGLVAKIGNLQKQV